MNNKEHNLAWKHGQPNSTGCEAFKIITNKHEYLKIKCNKLIKIPIQILKEESSRSKRRFQICISQGCLTSQISQCLHKPRETSTRTFLSSNSIALLQLCEDLILILCEYLNWHVSNCRFSTRTSVRDA